MRVRIHRAQNSKDCVLTWSSSQAWAPAAVDGETAVLGDAGLADTLGADEVGPPLAGRVLYGERANFERLVLGCIEADFCK